MSHLNVGFCGGSVSKKSTCNAGDLGSIPGLGISPGEGNGYPLQYSGLENSMDSGAWRAIVHWVTKSRTQLSNLHFSFLQYVILIQSSAHQKSFSLTGRSYFFFFCLRKHSFFIQFQAKPYPNYDTFPVYPLATIKYIIAFLFFFFFAEAIVLLKPLFVHSNFQQRNEYTLDNGNQFLTVKSREFKIWKGPRTATLWHFIGIGVINIICWFCFNFLKILLEHN